MNYLHSIGCDYYNQIAYGDLYVLAPKRFLNETIYAVMCDYSNMHTTFLERIATIINLNNVTLIVKL